MTDDIVVASFQNQHALRGFWNAKQSPRGVFDGVLFWNNYEILSETSDLQRMRQNL